MSEDCRLMLGDALDVLRSLPDGSADAVVTDPPAGIAFMGREWDKAPSRAAFVDFLAPILAECLRLAKPGARMLCWAIPRTSHWTGCAIEDAGWAIEDRVSHLFGQGFPKAKSKLKPACEDWWLARKPGPIEPLNVDGCRIVADWSTDPTRRGWQGGGSKTVGVTGNFGNEGDRVSRPNHAGRYPANLVLSHHPDCREVGTKRVKGANQPGKASGEIASSIGFGDAPGKTRRATYYTDADGLETVAAWECVEGCPVAELDRQSGDRPGMPRTMNRKDGPISGNVYDLGRGSGDAAMKPGYGDSGGASRFFATFGYFPKAPKSDRGEGNTHPTVKNTDLMRWLCRLITPPGGTVLDPFAGSGSTGKAAVAEGFRFLGVERDPAYFAIAERRLSEARAAYPLLSGATA